jgi:ketosteroid isomerase-like protein
MKKLLLFLLVGLAACNSTEDRQKEAKKEILSTDRAFSARSADKGMQEAFLFYGASDLVKLQDGQFPVIGKEALSITFNEVSDTMYRLTWQPQKAEVSESCDLGYTYGDYELYDFARNEIRYGNYFTVWRKEKDGTWRWVLDGGNTTPRPH